LIARARDSVFFLKRFLNNVYLSTQAANLIKDSAWEASRQQLRLIMGETRKSMTRLTIVRKNPMQRIPRPSLVCLS
jgi:hypothetical protein